jgi:hypothetical protein
MKDPGMRNEGDYLVPRGEVPRKINGTYLKSEPMADLSAPSKTQVGGTHYSKHKIQPWDYVAANDLGYFEGSIVKYITRWRDKGGVEDLKKARHFLDKLIEVSGA